MPAVFWQTGAPKADNLGEARRDKV